MARQLCNAVWAPLTTATLHLIYWCIVLLDGAHSPVVFALEMCSKVCDNVSNFICRPDFFETIHPNLVSAAHRICYRAARPGRRMSGPRTRSWSSLRTHLGAAYQLRNIVSNGWKDDVVLLQLIATVGLHSLNSQLVSFHLALDQLRHRLTWKHAALLVRRARFMEPDYVALGRVH
eukprot:1960583-Prymnesium_polylepis.1